MIVPIAIAVVSLSFVAWLVMKRHRRLAQLVKILSRRGFRRENSTHGGTIDFSVTSQWPEGRGIRYALCYVRESTEVSVTVAEVSCFVMAGANIGKCAAASSDEIRHTLISLRFADGAMPRFLICPKDMESRFRYLTEGGEEIETGLPEFDDLFFVLAKERDGVAPFVTSVFPSLLTQYPDVIVEAGGQTLLLYQQACLVTGDGLERRLDLVDKFIENITNA
jgi:hypothetical protein